MKATCFDVRDTVVAIVCYWPLFVVVLFVIVIVCDVRAVSLCDQVVSCHLEGGALPSCRALPAVNTLGGRVVGGSMHFMGYHLAVGLMGGCKPFGMHTTTLSCMDDGRLCAGFM